MVLGIALCCLAALLPSLMLFFPNMEEITFAGMLPYFGIMLGIGILVWAGMYLVFRRKGLAAMVAAVWLLVLLNAGRIVPVIHEVYPLVGIKVIGPVVLVFLAAVTFGLSRLKEEFLNDAVKVLCLALAAFIVATAVPQFFRGAETDDDEQAETPPVVNLAPAEGTDRPNIYWIVADEYAGFDELRKYFHYDNTPFYDRLREMGFTVSEYSYNWSSDTFTILRDTLSLNYTSSPGGSKGREKMVTSRDLPLWTLLKDLGYELCEAESTNKFRLVNRMKTEVKDDSPRTEDDKAVANLLLEYSILYRYEEKILQAVAPNLAKAQERVAIMNVFDWAEDPESISSEGPVCTVIYVKCPHKPYYFDRDGNQPPEVEKGEDDKPWYVDQLVFATKHLQKVCENIIAQDPDSIILLQSDHGNRFVANVTRLDQTNVLNAVYFRGKPLEDIVNKNMINTWRTVLRTQFNLDLPDVKEKRLTNEYRRDMRDPEQEDPNEGLIAAPQQ